MHDSLLTTVLAELQDSDLDEGFPTQQWCDFVRIKGPAALFKDMGQVHLTASCFVFNHDLTKIALTHHAKGNFWVQFGGHIDAGDASLAGAARREASEESGIDSFAHFSSRPIDLDRHQLIGKFTCIEHWDVGYLAITNGEPPLAVSDESQSVAWVACDLLPSPVANGFADRLAQARNRAADWLRAAAG